MAYRKEIAKILLQTQTGIRQMYHKGWYFLLWNLLYFDNETVRHTGTTIESFIQTKEYLIRNGKPVLCSAVMHYKSSWLGPKYL